MFLRVDRAHLVWWTEQDELLQLVGDALVQISLKGVVHWVRNGVEERRE